MSGEETPGLLNTFSNFIVRYTNQHVLLLLLTILKWGPLPDTFKEHLQRRTPTTKLFQPPLDLVAVSRMQEVHKPNSSTEHALTLIRIVNL